MSSCGNCDCADKSQCVKKGSSYGIEIIETKKSYFQDVGAEVPAAELMASVSASASASAEPTAAA